MKFKWDRIHKTRYPELGYVHQDVGLWRIVDLASVAEGNNGLVGPQYRSRAELLADLERYARVSWDLS